MNVYLYLVMKTYLVSLGSNKNKRENMLKCRRMLETYFQHITYSEMLETNPVGEDFTLMFFNQLAIISCDYELSEIKKKLKDIEKKLGRKTSDKSQGIVLIDLDVLAINESIVKPEDFERPYIDQLLLSLQTSDFFHIYDTYIKCSNSN